LPGILNWGIAGCLLCQKNGLIPPVASKLAINEYRGQMDAVGKWMEHCCTKKDNSKLPASIAYNSYLGWCSTNSLKPHSNTKFGKILSKLTNKSRAKRGVNYLGINLNSEGLKMADIAGEID
jgi:putative DNA primase/helicase